MYIRSVCRSNPLTRAWILIVHTNQSIVRGKEYSLRIYTWEWIHLPHCVAFTSNEWKIILHKCMQSIYLLEHEILFHVNQLYMLRRELSECPLWESRVLVKREETIFHPHCSKPTIERGTFENQFHTVALWSPRKTLSFLRCLHYLGYQKVWHVFEARIPSQEGAHGEEKDPRQGLSILFEVFSSSYTGGWLVSNVSRPALSSRPRLEGAFSFSPRRVTPPSLSRRCPGRSAKQQNTRRFSSRETFVLW